MARRYFLLLAILGGAFGLVPSARSKPSPPVILTLQAERETAYLPGDAVPMHLVLQGGGRPVSGVLSIDLPAGVQAVSLVPEFKGEIAPGETRTFSFTLKIQDVDHAPVTARFIPAGAAWSVQAHWQARGLRPLFPREGRAFRAHPLSPPVLSSAMLADSITVTGTWVYRDRAQDAGGFVNADLEDDPTSPVRRAQVEIYRSGVLMATGETSDTGFFSFRVTKVSGNYYARVTSGIVSSRFSVRGHLTNLLFTAETAEVAPQPGQDIHFGELLIEPGNGGEAFNILDACLSGALLVEELTGSVPKSTVNIRWGDPTASFYVHGSRTITLSIDDGYDDSVILHEYGHYVMKDYSQDQSPGGQHFVDDDHQNPLQSWGEGTASFWQTAIRDRFGDPIPTWYVDTDGHSGAGDLKFSYDCEGPSFPVLGTASEVVVQSSLWDIIDGPQSRDGTPGIDDDTLELPLAEVWEVLTDYIPGKSTLTLEDFWEGWFSPGIDNGSQDAMQAAFGALGVELFSDAFEPDNTVGSAAPLTVGGGTAHHTSYGVNDKDYHRLALSTGQVVIVETTNLTGWSDTKLQVLDPSLSLIQENDDRVPGVDISSQANFVAESTGDYTVIISKVSKGNSGSVEFGSYDVRALEARIHAYAFVSVAGGAGVDNSGFSAGPSFGDYDGDGALDLVVVNNSADAEQNPASEKDVLYRNQGNGVFLNTTQIAGIGHPEGGIASAWGDFDNDGDLDLFVSNHGLYRNDGGSFVDVSDSSGVLDLGSEFDGKWADADNDGYLDLFIPLRDRPSALWHNNGDGTFAEIAESAGILTPLDGGEAYACAWGDYDRDGRRDLFIAFNVAGDGHRLYHNLGDNHFLDVTEAAGILSTEAASGALWGDFNGDGGIDLYVCSSGDNKLYINGEDGTFQERAADYGVALTDYTRGAGLADYDLDGDLDLYLSNFGSPSGLFENVGGSMVRVNQASGNSNSFGMAWGDYDGDGDPDIYVAQARDQNLLWRNDALSVGEGLSWIKIKLSGVLSNRDGLGARITLFIGEQTQVREVGTGFGWASMSVQPELFGVPGGVVDSVRVDWPSGAWNVVLFPGVDQILTVVEDEATPVLPDGGSTRFAFLLGRPHPNPFLSATSVAFSLNQESRVRGRIFDLAGRRVATLVDQTYPAGEYRLGWDGSTDQGGPVSPGVYFYSLTAGKITHSRKIIRLQ